MAAKRTTSSSAGSGTLDTTSVLSTADVQWLKQFNYNPLRGFTPQKLVQAIESYDAGFIGEALRLWQTMARRDLIIQGVKNKREDAVCQRGWSLVTDDRVRDDGSLKKAARDQMARREFFWRNVRCIDPINTADQGGLKMFVRRVMEAQSFRHVPMHFVWRVLPKGLTATIYFMPPWLFETTTGTHRYLGATTTNVYGTEVDPTNWHFVSGRGLMEAGCIGYGYKHLALSSWVRFCARHGMPFPIGKLPGSAENSPEGVAMKKAIRTLHNDGGAVIFGNGEIDLLEANGNGEVFERLVDRIDRWASVAWRGGDLSSLSSAHGTGSNQQTKETLLTEAADCDFVSEVMQEIEARLDEYFDGPGVDVLVNSVIDKPSLEDFDTRMKVDEFLIKNGARLSIASTMEAYGREMAAEGDMVMGQPVVESPAETIAKPAVNAAAFTVAESDVRAALRADLAPLRELIAQALQADGKSIADEEWNAVLDALINNDGETEQVLNAVWFQALVKASGGTDEEVRALIAEATQPGGAS